MHRTSASALAIVHVSHLNGRLASERDDRYGDMLTSFAGQFERSRKRILYIPPASREVGVKGVGYAIRSDERQIWNECLPEDSCRDEISHLFGPNAIKRDLKLHMSAFASQLEVGIELALNEG